MLTKLKAFGAGAVALLLAALAGAAKFYKGRSDRMEKEAKSQKLRADLGTKIQKERDDLRAKQQERRNEENAQAAGGRRDHFDNNG